MQYPICIEWGDDFTATVHHQDGSRQIYEHDSNARLVSQTDPDGANHQKTYDEQGRLIAEKDPLGAVTEYQYHCAMPRLIFRTWPSR